MPDLDLTDPTAATLTELARAIRAGKLSPVALTRAYLDRIARLDGTLRAYITVDGDGALAAAAAREREAAAGAWRGPLHGVPLAHKDLCLIPGLPTSCGTRTSDYFVGAPPCTAVARLVAAGAVTLGKLNMTELALGPFGDNAHHGDVQNPWRIGHVSGGSSSGSGAAVAAGLAAAALGTDTGGSIRLPAACCGLAGLKPTYGRVSRAGVMPLSWSYDHVGPLARTVGDAALLLGVIAGHDPLDATSSRQPVPDYLAALEGEVKGLRVGVAGGFYADGLDADVARAMAEAVLALKALGAAVEPVAVPDPGPLVAAASNVMVRAEAAAIHARILKDRPGELQPAVRDRLAPGLTVTAVEYLQGQRLRARLTREFIGDVFSRIDVLATPTIPEPAPALAAAKAGGTADVIARMGRFSRLTRPFNALGLPALSLPCGASADGRPIALQLVGRPFDEATLLRVGRAYQSVTTWHRRRPALP
ncbi:MAG TPA: amidase [Methylomirabilota bacterium]|jgi:aspartyl-tRNA(Asn)/glutamyl-tRNA(Gln) amidotransferase subunit A